MRDDSIFDIIKRGGGLTDEAYIQGMVFTRIEELKREEASIKRLKRELEKAIAIALERNTGEQKIDALTINSIRELTISASNFKPIGRIVGNFANINTLKNTKVKKGDKIFIPSKPTSITVAGEVMTPGSLLWDKSKNSKDYILEAAGLTDIADKNKIFIISPNGKAQRASSLWSKEKPLFPGSTIVVPRKIELSSNLGRVSAITSVIYQLTLTFAGIDNLLSN